MRLKPIPPIALLILFVACAPIVQRTIRIDSQHQFKIQLQNPLKKFKVISRFGNRRQWYHTGIDLVGSKEILAAQSGKITQVGRGTGYGKMITIQHAYGYKTRYAHLKTYSVELGQRVKAGEQIGIMGKTGNATGVHLHFEVLTPAGRFIDPELALKDFSK